MRARNDGSVPRCSSGVTASKRASNSQSISRCMTLPPLPDDIQSPVCTTHVTCQYTCLSAAGGEEAHHEEALTHRQLGSAGVRVSVIGLGTNRFGAATVPQA